MPVDNALRDEAATALGVTIVRELRAGGQKQVCLVDKGGTQMVMKVIAVDSGMPDALTRAHREVDLLKHVSSPHFVTVASDLVELRSPVEGAAWLEDYLDGDDLADIVGTPWDWPEVATMAREVAAGLAAIHAIRVVHRDMSARNVRRLSSGRYVVMDPGFARHIVKSDLTVGGQPGTPGYLSPEHLQAYSGSPTPASDVFCVGILMFLTLTAHLPIPFTGDAADYIGRLARVELLDLSTLRSDLSPDATEVVTRCLHPQPARRYRTAQRLIDGLEALP